MHMAMAYFRELKYNYFGVKNACPSKTSYNYMIEFNNNIYIKKKNLQYIREGM